MAVKTEGGVYLPKDRADRVGRIMTTCGVSVTVDPFIKEDLSQVWYLAEPFRIGVKLFDSGSKRISVAVVTPNIKLGLGGSLNGDWWPTYSYQITTPQFGLHRVSGNSQVEVSGTVPQSFFDSLTQMCRVLRSTMDSRNGAKLFDAHEFLDQPLSFEIETLGTAALDVAARLMQPEALAELQR